MKKFITNKKNQKENIKLPLGTLILSISLYLFMLIDVWFISPDNNGPLMTKIIFSIPILFLAFFCYIYRGRMNITRK